MRASDIEDGMPFRFVGKPRIYISRGGGWYCSPLGYGGGPWCEFHNRTERVPTKLHSFSFAGFDNETVEACRPAILNNVNYSDGDIAILQYEYAKRGLRWEES